MSAAKESGINPFADLSAQRLSLPVVLSLICAGLALLLAAMSAPALLIKLVGVVSVGFGVNAVVHALRSSRPLEKPAATIALGLLVFLFAGSWQDMVSADAPAPPPPPDPTKQTVVPLTAAGPGTPPAAWKTVEATEFVDASQGAVKVNDVRVRVASAVLGRVKIKNRAANDPLTKPLRLQIFLRVTSANATSAMRYEGWSDAMPGSGKPEPKLTDNLGRTYRRTAFGAGLELTDAARPTTLTPGKLVKDMLVFDAQPLDGVQYLRLELPADALGGTGTLKLQIPRSMIQTSANKGKTP